MVDWSKMSGLLFYDVEKFVRPSGRLIHRFSPVWLICGNLLIVFIGFIGDGNRSGSDQTRGKCMKVSWVLEEVKRTLGHIWLMLMLVFNKVIDPSWWD
jgi:hypothetical protein